MRFGAWPQAYVEAASADASVALTELMQAAAAAAAAASADPFQVVAIAGMHLSAYAAANSSIASVDALAMSLFAKNLSAKTASSKDCALPALLVGPHQL